MKKPLMTLGAIETIECFHCKNQFDPEDAVYTIGEKERYCSLHCHNEELLIQEERVAEELSIERARLEVLGAEWPDLT